MKCFALKLKERNKQLCTGIHVDLSFILIHVLCIFWGLGGVVVKALRY